MTCVRLVSNLPPFLPPPSNQFPSLVCALSNMIWYGQGIEEMCHEETFRCLVELAFSLEPGSRYKISLNGLLCALCHINPNRHSLLLASCEDILFDDLDRMGYRLNTLAQVSQSRHCTEALLASELIGKMIARLTNGFEKLLQLALHPPPPPSVQPATATPTAGGDEDHVTPITRATVSSLCVLLAFFTDLLRNWRQAKEWMGCGDSHRFWSPMVEFLSMEASIISPLEVSFVQEVVYDFFSVCLLGCNLTKRTFVELVCFSLHNQQYRPAADPPVLALFLHKLLVGLVFQHESLPLILKVISSPEQVKSGNSGPLSLPSTCEVLEFHPSYPVSETCYYLRVPGDFSLSQLEELVNTHSTVKPKAELKKVKKPVHKPGSVDLGKPAKPPKPQAVFKVEDTGGGGGGGGGSLDVENFKFREWSFDEKDSGKTSSDDKSALSFCIVSTAEQEEGSIYRTFLQHYAKQGDNKSLHSASEALHSLVPIGRDYPMMVVMDTKSMVFSALDPDSASSSSSGNESMLSMLIARGGLVSLAKSIPPLYPYQWPTLLMPENFPTQVDLPPTITDSAEVRHRGSLKPHIILSLPEITPFRSLVMLGQCLHLEVFGRILEKNTAASYTLLRLLLGEDIGTKGGYPGGSVLMCVESEQVCSEHVHACIRTCL